MTLSTKIVVSVVALAAIATAVVLLTTGAAATVIGPGHAGGFTVHHSWDDWLDSLDKVSRSSCRLTCARSAHEPGLFARASNLSA
ncbi:hypothetical protein [Amycolatopsis sp. TNS106]|uniref:hypothetical protein n=1 Tax=Amycolatopsis sp. TNS106 TaxID=2861750 RepID=UPI001C58FDC2|nr:hypothetical protein [Amycolatopsis sp. TNS106]